MRRTFSIVATAMLALAVASATVLPAATYAASPGRGRHGTWGNGNSGSLTGTLVATPQATLPATLLLQVNGTTVSVVVSATTQITDASGNVLSLTALVDGDTLRVNGTGDQTGPLTATTVQDMSRSAASPTPVPAITSYQATGTLAVAYGSLLCLQSASVTNGAIAPSTVAGNPCPSGDLPVYFTTSTTFENASGTAIAAGSLAINDSVSATGSISNGQLTASLVQDLTQTSTPTTTYSYQATGTLAVAYGSLLCLQNASVTNGAIAPSTVAGNPCPSGDLPVYFTTSTTFENASGTAVAAGSLAVGNSVTATGSISNGQLTASLVQDLTLTSASTTSVSTTTTQTTPVTLVGVVQACNFSGRTRTITIRVEQGSMRGVYTISMQSNMQVLSRNGGRAKYTSIHKGQTVTFMASYNKHNRHWGSISRVQIH